MSLSIRRRLWLGLALLLGACAGEAPKRAKLAETIPNLPVPPNAEVLGSTGGEDALQIRFRSSSSVEDVTQYYRGVLSRDPWRLVSDAKTEDGGIALYAEQNGPSLWVTIRKADGAAGTLIELAGGKTKAAGKTD